MSDSETNLSAPPADAALASFVLLAQFLGVPAEPAQIHHDRGQGDRPYDFDDLIRIAKKLGLMARRKRAAPAEFPKLPLPALVHLRDGGTAILPKVDDTGDLGNRHMVLKPDSQRLKGRVCPTVKVWWGRLRGKLACAARLFAG